MRKLLNIMFASVLILIFNMITVPAAAVSEVRVDGTLSHPYDSIQEGIDNVDAAETVPDITVDPIEIDFGNPEVFTSSPPVTVTITNEGMADLNIGTITISESDDSNFHIQNDSCSGQALAPGHSADLEVVFRPDTTGPFSAALSIPSDDPDEGLVNIPLSGTAHRSSYTDKPICIAEDSQEKPAIYWDRIVWEHEIGYSDYLHMYDLTTEEEIEIPSAGKYGPNDPAIWGDRIVWKELGGSPVNVNIYMYDLATEEVKEICTAASYQESPAIWEDRIVWRDYRNGNYDIYMYDLATEQEIPICTEESSQYSPAIWGDYIVWTDNRNECLVDNNSDIYLYDLSTGTEKQITTDLRVQGSPAIWEDRIVWTDQRNGNNDIYMYDLTTEQETAICTEENNQSSPAIWGDYIVWTDSRGYDADIYLYEITTGTEVALCTAAKGQSAPAIWGHRVVWEDRRNTASSDVDIYSSAWVRPGGADLSITMTDLTDPVEKGYYLTYVLNVTNYGPSDASGVEVTDSLPAGMEIISATSSQGSCLTGQDTVWGLIGSISAGDTATLTVVVRPDDSGVVTNEATVEANETDFLEYNNTATESTRVSRRGIVRAAGSWYAGAWLPSLTAGPDGEVHMSYTREGSGCIEFHGPTGFQTAVIHGFDDIYYTSTASAWFHKQQIYDGYGTTFLATTFGWQWWRYEPGWSVIATDDAGNIHIVYVRHDHSRSWLHPNVDIDSYYYLMYVNNVGGTWNQPEQVAEVIQREDNHSEDEYGGFWDISLAIDSSGGAHITYINYVVGDITHFTNQYGSWVSETIMQEDFDAYEQAAMVLDSNDHMHIAFYSADCGGRSGLFYLTDAPLGGWNQPEFVDNNWSGGQLEGMCLDIAIDDDDNPHISYVSGGGAARQDTYYATKQGGVWTCTQVDEGAYQSAGNSIAVDSSGEAHIAYYHVPTGDLKYATSTDGWQPETIEEIPGAWSYTDIAVDTQDMVHIVYSNKNYIYHAMITTPAGEDIDHDGVPGEEEQGPDGLNPAYDGNNDGTADCEQGNVVSLHTADGTYYVTVASANGTLLSNCQTVDGPSPEEAPVGAEFPFGCFDFTVYGLEPGAATTVDIYLPPGLDVESYYKYGATSDNETPHWYEFFYDGETGAMINENVVTLHLTDGGRGDGDITANGVIWEPGGPSTVSLNTPPTAPEVYITPDEPFTDNDLTCTVTSESTDPDDDTIIYTYEWYIGYDPNTAQKTRTTGLTDTVSSILTTPGDTCKCVVTPNDGTVYGPPDEDQVTIGTQVVTFLDANLEAVIRDAIAKPDGDIYDADLLSIKTLNGQGNNIADLTGLEYCTNLQELYLNDNQIVDISSLVANAGIASGDLVNLENNPLSDDSLYVYIPALEARGVNILYDYPLLGDADGDGLVNIFDMTKVARIILELDDPTPGADANQDGSINIFDMTKIARIILELD